MFRTNELWYICRVFVKDKLRSPILLRVLLALLIGIISARLCYIARNAVNPGLPGDFVWALDTARDLLAGRDPYAAYMGNISPTPFSPIPYPLPVALFGFPFLWLKQVTASSIFFSLVTASLAYGILRSGDAWRLLVFLTFPFLNALINVQWSPLIMAAWYFPILAPLLVLVK
jgi:hypothetical protein